MKEILISSSALILLVLLLRWILRGKVRQKLLYAAWLLVALRLLVPVQFGQWQYSMNTLTQTVAKQSETLQQAEQLLQTPVQIFQAPEQMPQVPATEPTQKVMQPVSPQETPKPTEVPEPQLQEPARKPAPTLSQILKSLWLAGVGLMALWFLLTNLSFRRKIKAGVVVLETNAPLPVRVSNRVPSPCLVGLVRPVIYVTPECARDPQMLHHVITHEMAHLKQWDPVWSFVRCVCLCIYWFNPLVWVAAVQSRRDCELSCDESALRQLGDEERIAYGKTLLTMVRSASPAALLNTATSMSESKKRLKERMCFIVKKPRHIVIAAVAMTLIIALAAGCAFTGDKAPETTPPESDSSSQETPTTEQTEPTTSKPEQTEPTTTVPEQTDAPLIPNPHSLFPTVSPVVQTEGPSEAQLIAKEAIAIYRTYCTIGVCCEMEQPEEPEDMSQYLTEAQKEDYYNCQYRITCCKTVEEVHNHINRHIGKGLQHDYTDKNLFTDDEGNLYIMVLPTSYDSYRHYEVLSQTKDEIICRACSYFEPECDDSDIFTLKASDNGYRVTNVERDREYVCEVVLLEEGSNYQLYKHGNTGYSGMVETKGYGTFYFQEDFYCPAVKMITENLWEITTDYGNGFVRRIYCGHDPKVSQYGGSRETYDYAIALGYGKIAYLDGELNQRTLVICDLLDRTTAQTFTQLGFKAENMPVTAAAFSENDTKLTLTYDTDQGTENNVTLELSP